MKKVCSLILIFTLVFMVSCGNNTDNQSGDENSLDASSIDIDMFGYNCVIIQDDDAANPFRYVNTTLFSDLAKNRIADVEKKYNCTIELKYAGYNDDIVSYVSTNSLAMLDAGEAMYSAKDNVAGRLSAAGYLYPLTELKDIINYEDSEKWGGANFLETAMHDSIPYAVAPMYWPMKQPPMCYIIIFNAAAVPELGLVDPREYIDNKNWTWETYEEFFVSIPAEYNGREYAAMVEFPMYFAKMAVLGNGVDIVKEVDGNYVSDMQSAKAVDALSWAMNFGNKHRTRFYQSMNDRGSWENRIMPVVDGDAFMGSTATWVLLNEVMYKMDKFGILPYPVGPQGEQGKWPGVLETMDSLSIIGSAAEPDYAAHIVNSIFEPLEGYETQEDRDAYLDNEIFHDQRDVAMWRALGQNAKFSYWTVGGDSFWYATVSSFFSTSASEFIQKNISSIQKTIDENMIPNLEYLNNH